MDVIFLVSMNVPELLAELVAIMIVIPA
jgi:hypothetical protein